MEVQFGIQTPHTKGIQKELEKVQNRAGRFVSRYSICNTPIHRLLSQAAYGLALAF